MAQTAIDRDKDRLTISEIWQTIISINEFLIMQQIKEEDSRDRIALGADDGHS